MIEQSAERLAPNAKAAREPLDPELERRVAALESPGTDAGSDFDSWSWFWMAMLGVVGPAALLLWGWFGR
jgi:hypothetical protein